MFLSFQNRTYKPRQHTAGPHLDKGAHARLVHVQDLFNEMDRARELPSKHLAGFIWIGRILLSRRIRVNGDLCVVKLKGLKRFQERFAGIGDESAVKCRRHAELGAAETAIRKHRDGILDSVCRARQHRLRGRVLVRHRHIQRGFFDCRYDVIVRRANGQHGAAIFVSLFMSCPRTFDMTCNARPSIRPAAHNATSSP